MLLLHQHELFHYPFKARETLMHLRPQRRDWFLYLLLPALGSGLLELRKHLPQHFSDSLCGRGVHPVLQFLEDS